MEAEHFDDIIRKKLEQIQTPPYSDSKWAAIRSHVVVPNAFDYKGAIAAASLLLNLVLMGWLWNTTTNDGATQSARRSDITILDTVIHRTVVYDTIHHTIYRYTTLQTNEVDRRTAFASKPVNHSLGYNATANQDRTTETATPPQSIGGDGVNRNDTSVGNEVTAVALAVGQDDVDSTQLRVIKKDSAAFAKAPEETRHERVYKPRREIFITPTLSIPFTTTGDAEHVKSKFVGIEISYMPFNRVGFFIKGSRYNTGYSVYDDQFERPEGGSSGGGYGGGLEYEYINSSIDRVAWSYTLGARAIVLRERYWQAIADVSYGKFFADKIQTSNRLREVVSGKYVFSEIPEQHSNNAYLAAAFNVERSLGYRVRLRLGVEVARNVNAPTYDNHIEYWSSFNTGLSYQLK
jgi:hypothetical protein